MTRGLRYRVAASACAIGTSAGAAVPIAPLGDIVVTATRREALLSSVPISISAYDQRSMDAKGLRDIADVARTTPGVTFDPLDNSVAIRGVISTAGSGATGIYLNDTPIQIRAIGFASDDTLPAIFDLERVEILRGPQGTLFGAGSEGGTVRYITRQPNLDHLSSYARAELATTAHGGMSYEAGAALGAPIVRGRLGFRVSAWHRRDGGWVDRVDNATNRVTESNANHSDVTALRAALAWRPIDALTITPSIHFQNRVAHDTDVFWAGISDPGHGVFRNGSPDRRRRPDRFILPTIKIEGEVGTLRLINTTSWYNRREVGSYDGTVYNLSYYQQLLPGTDAAEQRPETDPNYPLLTDTGINRSLPYYVAPARVLNRQRSFTQELRLQGGAADAAFTWTVGLFFQRSRQLSVERISDPSIDTLFGYLFGDTVESVLGAPLYRGRYSYSSRTDSRERQLAAFGEGSYALTRRLRATVGLRYASVRYAFRNAGDGSQNGGPSAASGGDTAHPLTPRLGLSYQIGRDRLVYASWARGFRAGGATPPAPAAFCADDFSDFGIDHTASSYRPDKVTSVEVGGKASLLDRRLQLAASAYTLRWHGIQQYVLLPTCGFQYTDNVGNARVRGFELQLAARPLPGVSIDASAGYADARYASNSLPTGASGGQFLVRRGDTLGGSPWTLHLGAEYDGRLGKADAYARADYQYSSANRRRLPAQDPATAVYDAGTFQPGAVHEVNLRAGIRWRGLDASLFVTNLLDAAPRLSREHMDAATLLYTQQTLKPRTIGVTLAHVM